MSDRPSAREVARRIVLDSQGYSTDAQIAQAEQAIERDRAATPVDGLAEVADLLRKLGAVGDGHQCAWCMGASDHYAECTLRDWLDRYDARTAGPTPGDQGTAALYCCPADESQCGKCRVRRALVDDDLASGAGPGKPTP